MNSEQILKTIDLFLADSYVVANLSNVTAYLYDQINDLNWLGFYFFQDNQLVLGPFQGKVACTPLSLSRGVCAACFNSQQVTNVKDVHEFKDHIACDSASNSELVIPLFKNEICIGVLDIDSPLLNRFDPQLEKLFTEVGKQLSHYFDKYPLYF